MNILSTLGSREKKHFNKTQTRYIFMYNMTKCKKSYDEKLSNNGFKPHTRYMPNPWVSLRCDQLIPVNKAVNEKKQWETTALVFLFCFLVPGDLGIRFKLTIL
jgi:hypothetical protein